YNEENRISRTLLDINRYLSKKKYSYEILVVNDGSKDRTVEVVKKLEDKIKNLKLISNNENYGKGYVVKKSMLEAKGDYRLFMDADNSTSIDCLESFFTYFREGFDIVIGSIAVKGSQIIEKSGLHRRILGNLSKYLIRIIAIS
ncbi:MAG: glycosyltransferase, partial [Omnitrophica bacterium]|nr:glycosyltransferase [Candidatus Omnitrophota bacterium]